MNTKTAWQLLSSLTLCIGSSGCGHEHAPVTVKSRDACADYGGLTALLAEATVRCTGTIGPESFAIGPNGLLQSKFTACTNAPEKENLEQVTKLLQLQAFHSALPRFQECLTDRYSRWSELFKRTNLKTCPVWTEPTVIGAGDRASIAQLSRMQPKLQYVPASEKDPRPKPTPDERFVGIEVPSKSSILYKISYPLPEPACVDPAVCAAQCAAFLPGFVLSAAGTQLLADPASWYRSDNGFAPCSDANTLDPWCPPFVHAMSVTRTSYSSYVPPGDLYGHPNRAHFGEHCFRWVPDSSGGPGFNYETDLVLECTDPAQTNCLSRCGN
jgi:hypothetical protein